MLIVYCVSTHMRVVIQQGEASTTLALSTSDVDLLMQAMARKRTRLKPAISKDAPASAKGVYDPIWVSRGDPRMPDKIIAIRHSAFGWVDFLFPPASAKKLSEYLAVGLPRSGDPSQSRRN